MAQDAVLKWADVKPVEMVPGLMRRTLSETADAMLVEARAQAGAVVPLHQHVNQQIVYVVSGRLELTMNGTTHVCQPGDSLGIEANVEHSAYFPVETVQVDCFSPPRAEYR